jgi:O-antigen ligase
MAILLVASIPFVAAIATAEKVRTMQRYSAVLAILGGLAIVIMVGIALNGSLAGYGLALPVAAASLLIFLPPASRVRLWVVGAAALMMIGALIALQSSPVGSGSLGERATGSVSSRAVILSTTAKAARDFMPFGSGFGSFRSVYPLYEEPTAVTKTFVIHAHNDYAELILELGLPGALLILLFIAWWGIAVWRIWDTTEPRPFARAAAIASAAILVHSFVDFPLRTAAVAALFAVCLALLADSRAAPPEEKSVLRRKRHVEFK